LHYGSVPFAAFPFFHPTYATRRPLASACVEQLGAWAAAARAARHRLRWTFSASDGLSLCAVLPAASFAVVGSSNLMDHVGLLPLLQATRGLVRDGGYLLTQSLIGFSYADSHADLLRQHLGMDPCHWPGLLGWRCLGLEGELAPEHSAFQLEPPDVVAAYQMGNACGVVRSEANFLWTPALPSNLLPVVGRLHVDLVARCRLTVRHSPLGPLVGPITETGTHLLSLLPMFLGNPSLDRLLRPSKDWEVHDLVHSIRRQTPLHEATLRVSATALHFGAAAQARVGVVLAKGPRLIVYSGLSVTRERRERGAAAGGGGWVARWLLHPARLTADTRVLLVQTPLPPRLDCVLAVARVDELALRPVAAAELSAWAARFCSPPPPPSSPPAGGGRGFADGAGGRTNRGGGWLPSPRCRRRGGRRWKRVAAWRCAAAAAGAAQRVR